MSNGNNNGAPDSWEQQAETNDSSVDENSADVSGKFSTLNVNAAEFVPSFLSPKTTTESLSEETSSPEQDLPVTNGDYPKCFYHLTFKLLCSYIC